MLPPPAPPDAELGAAPVPAAVVLPDFPPLLPQAASTPETPARPATPAAPFSTVRRLGCTAAAVAGGIESLSRMAASIAAQTVSHEIHHEHSKQRPEPLECQPSGPSQFGRTFPGLRWLPGRSRRRRD